MQKIKTVLLATVFVFLEATHTHAAVRADSEDVASVYTPHVYHQHDDLRQMSTRSGGTLCVLEAAQKLAFAAKVNKKALLAAYRSYSLRNNRCTQYAYFPSLMQYVTSMDTVDDGGVITLTVYQIPSVLHTILNGKMLLVVPVNGFFLCWKTNAEERCF